MKILCLHGNRQNAEIFRTRLGKIYSKLTVFADINIIDAPNVLEILPGNDLPFLTWYFYAGSDVDKSSLDRSLKLIEKTANEKGPFDGIIGFSMGGELAAYVSSLNLPFTKSLKFVICIGAPCFRLSIKNVRSDIRSLHFGGQKDDLVSIESSRQLSKFFCNPTFVEHELGHCIPMKSNYIDIIVKFCKEFDGDIALSCRKHVCSTDQIAESQAEEIEAISAIFSSGVSIVGDVPLKEGDACPIILVNFQDIDSCESIPQDWRIHLSLSIQLTNEYPFSSVPEIKINVDNISMSSFTLANKKSLSNAVQSSCEIGNQCLYSIISAAVEWIGSGNWTSVGPLINCESDVDTKLSANALDLQAIDGFQLTNSTSEKLNIMKIGSHVWYENIEDNEELIQLESQRIAMATEEAFLMAKIYREKHQENHATEDVSEKSIGSASSRGLWNYVVGLVGKPSAGKSTFYNAVTRAVLNRDGRKMAEVAPHPFTTIEPNIGPGWFSGPVEEYAANSLGEQRGSMHGKDDQGRRLLPILIKDVAGLVPGAYQGRGKGNQFLADLCDADVLIHVVDSTGQSDREGNIIVDLHDTNNKELVDDKASKLSNSIGMKASSPMEDSKWIREELHRWISGNIRAKWRSVYRRSSEKSRSRLLELFSGYHNSHSCVLEAVERANLNWEQLQQWGPLDIHRLVAHFLSIRFPICLALNKIDRFASVDDANRVISQCQMECLARGEVAVPMSAQAETWKLWKEAHSDQSDISDAQKNVEMKNGGGSSISSSKTLSAFIRHQEENNRILDLMLTQWHSTGVLQVISQAVMLKPPIFCYPVADFDHEYPLGWSSGMSTSERLVCPLRDCLLFKPGSCVEDVFDALKHGGISDINLCGDFVRAEGRSLDPMGRKRQLGRDVVISEGCCVLRIQTNRKSMWQHSFHQQLVTQEHE